MTDVLRSFDNKAVVLHAKVKVRISEVVVNEDGSREPRTSIIDTTVGRALLAEILPEGLPFALVNTELTKKNISRLINTCYRMLGLKDTVVLAGQPMYNSCGSTTRAGGA